MRPRAHECDRGLKGSRTREAQAPRVLLAEFLHPQEEEADDDVAVRAAPVVAVEAVRVEVASGEAEADREQGVRRRVEGVQGHPLARALEMRQNEGEQQRDGAEAFTVVRGHLVAHLQLTAVSLHVRGRLARAVGSQPWHPEDQRVRGGGILEIPVLQVAQVLVARSSQRGVLLEQEAPLDLPDHGSAIVRHGCQLAPWHQTVRELRELVPHLGVREGHRIGVLDVLGDESTEVILHFLGLLCEEQEFLLRERPESREQCLSRCTPILHVLHDHDLPPY